MSRHLKCPTKAIEPWRTVKPISSNYVTTMRLISGVHDACGATDMSRKGAVTYTVIGRNQDHIWMGNMRGIVMGVHRHYTATSITILIYKIQLNITSIISTVTQMN